MNERQNVVTHPKRSIQEQILGKIYRTNARFIIFDIGACEGLNSIRYARLYPNAIIYLIEPLPSNVQLIKSNIETYRVQNARCHELCFSNKVGISEFYVSSGQPEKYNARSIDWDFGNKSSSLLPPDKHLEVFPWIKFEENINVQTEKLETFCAKENIFEIGFVHMDVQGGEMLVLEGAGSMIYNINSIWLEVEAIPLYKDQPLKTDIEEFLSEKNFTKVVDTVGDIAGDQFWVNSNLVNEHAFRITD